MNNSYSIWLQSISIGAHKKNQLLACFKNAEGVYKAKGEDYKQIGLEKEEREKLVSAKAQLEKAEEVERKCKELGLEILDQCHGAYPNDLREIPDAPIVLFAKGDLEVLRQPLFAIVGARKCSEYGYEIAYRLGAELAERGIAVISGMALGIDEAAHKGALSRGKTIAVLGTGLDQCYPKQNYNIYREIPTKGCLLTEYEPGVAPLGFHFPQRNRIISGLSKGLLVVEANEKSGSLITANLALEYNRDVFAVPGNINSCLSLGTNDLIKRGAKCVTIVGDILEELAPYFQEILDKSKKNSLLNPDYKLAQRETIVYAYVSWNPICLEELLAQTNLSYVNLLNSIIELETHELIKRLPGERYVRMK